MRGAVQSRVDGAVGFVILDRAERHNSLIPDFLDEISAALDKVDRDGFICAAVLRAEGTSFSTGGDLGEFLDHWDGMDDVRNYAESVVGRLNEVVLQLLGLRVPVVAAVQGWVTGGSLELVLGRISWS